MPQEHHNPFPGLRPFRDEEDYLFFGREEQTLELVSLLRQHRFLAVVGTSGSGKSSLVRAGLLPALHGGTMSQAGSAWEVVVMKPGGDPIANLARALVDADFYDPEDKESIPRLEATLTRSRQGLVEAVKQSDADPGSNVLIVVDQFEELFRFRQRGLSAQEAAGAFVKLLLHASDQSEHPVFIAITMRSDYLGDCAQVPGLAEAVNDGEYLIPRLRRQQRRDAIEKPVQVGGAEIAERLVQRLLNDVGDDADQLPVLQHALMRTWDVWKNDHTDAEPIDLRHYQAAGGMEQALSLHADSVYASLPDDAHRTVAEKLFKALTERTSDNREIRRPQKLADLAAIAGASPDQITTVLDAYRQPGVTFVMPTSEVELAPDTVVDISHESLMRVWSRLRGWVDSESQSARIYHRLFETSQLWQQKKAGLYHDPDLGIAHAWRDANEPTAAWADLYGGGFDTATAFLDASQQAADQEAREKEQARQRELAHAKALAESQARTASLLKRFAATIAVALVVAVGLSIYAFKLKGLADHQSELAGQKAAEAEEAKSKAHLAQGKTSLAISRAAAAIDHHFPARITAARAIGFKGFGAEAQPESFAEEYPELIKADQPEWQEASRRARAGHKIVPAWVSPSLHHHPDSISTLAIHPDGKIAATGGEDTDDLFLWDLESGRALPPLSGHSRDVEALAFSHDGTILASAGDQGDNEIIIWDAASFSEKTRLSVTSGNLDSSGIHAMAFSPDDRFLVAGDEVGTLFLIDVVQQTVEEHPGAFLGRAFKIAYTPDGGTLVVCGHDRTPDSTAISTLALLDPSSLETRVLIPINVGDNSSLTSSFAISPDGSWMVASARFNTPEIWDLTSDPPTRLCFLLRDFTERNPDFQFRCDAVAVSDDGQRIAVGWNDEEWDASSDLPARPTISVFDSTDPSAPVHLHDHTGHADFTRCLEFVPGSHHYLAGDDDGLLTHRDADTPPAGLSPLAGHPDGVRTLAVSPDGRWIATSDRAANTFLWDAAAGEIVSALSGAGDFANDAVFSADSKTLYTAHYRAQTVHTWEVPTGAPRASQPTGFVVDSIALSPDGRSLAAAGDARLLCRFPVTADGGLATGVTSDLDHWCSQLAYLPDGRLVAAGANIITLFGHELDGSLTEIASVGDIHQGSTSAIAVQPDGNHLAVASRNGAGVVTFWDIGDRSLTQSRSTNLRELTSSVSDIAYSPDGSLLLTCDSANIRLWDPQSGNQVTVIPSPANPRLATFTPDSRYVLGGVSTGALHLWDLGGSPVLHRWSGLAGQPANLLTTSREAAGPFGIAYTADFSKLAIAGGFDDAPSNVRIWDFETSAFTRSIELPDHHRSNDIELAPGGQRLAISTSGAGNGTSGSIYLVDLTATDNTPPVKLYDGSGAATLKFHPNGKFLAAAHADNQLRIFPVPGSLDGLEPGEGTVVEGASSLGAPRGLAFTSGGTKLVAGNRNNVFVIPFAPDSGELGEPALLPLNWAFGVAAAPDGSFFASVAPAATEIRLWDSETLAPIGAPLPLPIRPIRVWASSSARLFAAAGNSGAVAVVDASDPQNPFVVADFSFPDASGWFYTRKIVFGPDNKSITISQEDGSVSSLSLKHGDGTNDLARYLDIFHFDDGGNVVWQPDLSSSLASVAPGFPPHRATSPYLGFLLAPGLPDTEKPQRLFQHFLDTDNLAAAESALLSFPAASPPSPASWQDLAKKLSRQFNDAYAGQPTRLPLARLEAVASRITEHTQLPLELQFSFLISEGRWAEAEKLVVANLAADAPTTTTLLEKFFTGIRSIAHPSETSPPTPSLSQPPLPDLPPHLALASAVRDLASDTIQRLRTNSLDSLVPADQHPTTLAAYLVDHCLASTPPLLPKGSVWNYFPENLPAPDGWNQPGFDDSRWPSGPADIGFGRDAEDQAVIKTSITRFLDRITYYFRHTFELGSVPGAESVTLFLQRDDSVAIYLNGTEVFRNYLPAGPIDDLTPAHTSVPTAEEFNFLPFTIPATQFVSGSNTLAVEVHQNQPRSSDIHFDLAITTAPFIAPDAVSEAVALIQALADKLEPEEEWPEIAIAALGPENPSETLATTVTRSRIQALLLQRENELASLKSIAAKFAGASDPADWRLYRDALRRQARLMRAVGQTDEVEALNTQIAVAPPRPENLTATQLDLTQVYNSSLYEGSAWVPYSDFNATNLGALPETLAPHDGIVFDARGILQLDSGVYTTDSEGTGFLIGESLSSLSGRELPARVDGIPVGQTAKALHLLGAVLHTRSATGTQVGTVTLNYADGSSHPVPLLIDKNITGLWANHTPEDPSIIAWTGPARTASGQVEFQLSKITCPNPHPEKQIVSFDFVSSRVAGAPFIVAATIEP